MKRPPSDIWTMRPGELFERAYLAKVERNPLAVRELQLLWAQLELDPLKIGRQLDRPDDPRQHWLYESPRMPGRARLRVYYVTDAEARVVLLQALDLI